MIKNSKIIYPKLSYQLIGLSFEVFNDLGFGLQEKYYQRSFEILLKNNNIKFEKEKYINLKFKNETIGSYYFDYYIENKIILEFKVVNKLGYIQIKQILNYLKSINCKLGILIFFTKDGVKYRRILNYQ